MVLSEESRGSRVCFQSLARLIAVEILFYAHAAH